jgi:hypothetical protein
MAYTHLDSAQELKEEDVFGDRVGIFARVFGCRHSRMSMPVTTANITYQYCASCGIRRKYDPLSFKPERTYYYPTNLQDLHHV